jgi:type IV pilus biogenesis protein PilP
MNRFRSPRKSVNLAAALAVLLCSTTSAFAQDAALKLRDGKQPGDPVVAVPELSIPADASLGESNARVKALATEADQGLDRLVEGAITSEGNKANVDETAKSKERVMLLQQKLEEAKVAVEYWETVNGKDHRADEKIKSLEAEKTGMEKELSDLRQQLSKAVTQRRSGPTDPDPVVADITGAAGSVKAKILIPYMGEISAKRGDILPNGQRVVSISSSGVTVARQDGTPVVLGFGKSVPAVRPVSAGAGVPMPVSQ